MSFVMCLTACVSNAGHRLAKVSVGMTKAEVIALMGPPTSASVSEGAEVLHYGLGATRVLLTTDFTEYYVRLVDGRVKSYGDADELERAGR